MAGPDSSSASKGKDKDSAAAAASAGNGSAATKDAAASTSKSGDNGKDSPSLQAGPPSGTVSTGSSTPHPADGQTSALTMQAVLDYLKSRGFEKAEAVVKAEMKAFSAGKTPEAALAEGRAAAGPDSAKTISVADLAAKSAPRDPEAATAARDGDKAPQQSLQILAAEALRIDKTDRIRGFGMVRNWCEGGLDVYQVSGREGQVLRLKSLSH